MNGREKETTQHPETELLTAGKRRVVLVTDAPKADTDSVARVLARILTNGDPVGYVRKLQEKKKAAPCEN